MLFGPILAAGLVLSLVLALAARGERITSAGKSTVAMDKVSRAPAVDSTQRSRGPTGLKPDSTSAISFTPTITTYLPITVRDYDPSLYATLGPPFARDCGDGIPRIWSNDSFNGPTRLDLVDDHHGHVDIFVPEGCNIYSYTGELIAPVSGVLRHYEHGSSLILPEGIYIAGIQDALMFIGIDDFDLSEIAHMKMDIGHVQTIEGSVRKGQSIGEVIEAAYHYKIGYQITVWFRDQEYMFTPTLFRNDPPFPWPCVAQRPDDCEPKPYDYPP
jgi:hypothetical protein